MNGAAAGLQEVALRIQRLAEPDHMAVANCVALLKFHLSDAQKFRGSRHVGLGQVNEALHLAAASAALLAGEAQRFHFLQHFTLREREGTAALAFP